VCSRVRGKEHWLDSKGQSQLGALVMLVMLVMLVTVTNARDGHKCS
jgi:hypothetical protein